MIEQELSGILNWAIEGLQAWQRDGLPSPTKVHQAIVQYRSDMDIIEQWIDECCNLGPAYGPTPTDELFRSYRAFCEETGVTAIAKRALGRKLADRALKPFRSATRRGFSGIALKTAAGDVE